MKIFTKKASSLAVSLLAFSFTSAVMAAGHGDHRAYADFPVTLKGYTGDKKTSVAYTGQAARQLYHTSLKKLAGKGNGQANPELEAQMMDYFTGKKDLPIIDPVTKGAFVIKQTNIGEIGSGSLADKSYKGAVTGWPGNMTGQEVLEFLIKKAAATEGGYDPLNGYDYSQLISKYIMGAVFYNQIVDNYLDEKLNADNKPNDKPYSEGGHYTGKEHSWDEGWGYFGAPANALTLAAKDVYAINKRDPKVFKKADANGDGAVDLYTEMSYALAYYAAAYDRKGKTDYLHTITEAFVNGRQLIADAQGEALTDAQRSKLKGYAAIVHENLEKVLAEAVFHYAGSVFKDLQKLQVIVESNGDASKVFRDYVKHWGELKGFSLSLQAGKNNLGETAVRLNRLIGFSPVLLGNTQVNGIDADGNYTQATSESMEEYMLHMLKAQKLLIDEFGIQARSNDATKSLGDLAEQIGAGSSAEND